MPIGTYIAVFFVVWWLSFVAVLPIGNKSQFEAGDIVAGTEPGAPAVLRMWRKVGLATIVAIVATLLLFWGLSNETLYHYWNR